MFPDKLAVSLQERFPVARVQAQDGQGRPKQLFVAKDGVVYDGKNYDMKMVGGLPWLDGIRLVRQGSGFAPIAGMADVAALLTKAQIEAPHLYQNWLVVSLAKLADRDEITVKSQDAAEIIFSRKVDFYKQIAQLDSVLEMAKQQPDAVLRSINLSLAGQVPVKFERAPNELARPEYSPQFTLQPLQRKGQRDF
jgi:cell division protein FtsQ